MPPFDTSTYPSSIQKRVQSNLYGPRDAYKTAFTIGTTVYYNVRMPFRLQNARCAFQKLMNNAFAHQLDHKIKAFIDDVIVKSMTFDNHLANQEETFQTLLRYTLKLNPE